MIKILHIKDFALIEELEVNFKRGLNILTGQTGAGKSIILGALNMILGERADTGVIRQGSSKAVAEAIFDIEYNQEIKNILKEKAVESAEELILRREIRNSGSRAFINDTPVTVGILKKVGNYLVDLHGQHEHQLLLDEDNHRDVVDGFGDIDAYLNRYQHAYRSMRKLRKEKRNLQRREEELQEKMKLYQFQKEELDDANLKKGEEQELEEEIKLLSHAEDLMEKTEAVVEKGGGAQGVMEQLGTMKMYLEDLARIEPEFKSYLKEISEARISLQEMVSFCQHYQSSIEFNPQRLEELRRRQDELNQLQKKYNRDLPALITYLQQIKEELKKSLNFEVEIEKIDKKISAQAQKLKKAAVQLHQQRVRVGKELSKSIVDELHHLGIHNAQFEVPVDYVEKNSGWITINGHSVRCGKKGCDELRFYISTNKGEKPKPLAAVASGGEISRVMLALKSTLAKQESLPVMIFDEIDSGISGEISEKVGRTMRSLSQQCQIIAITHQPQIASQAHKHYKVAKTELAGRTTTSIRPLSQQEHIKEIAGLMSGEEITDAGLKNARELVEKHTFQN